MEDHLTEFEEPENEELSWQQKVISICVAGIGAIRIWQIVYEICTDGY